MKNIVYQTYLDHTKRSSLKTFPPQKKDYFFLILVNAIKLLASALQQKCATLKVRTLKTVDCTRRSSWCTQPSRLHKGINNRAAKLWWLQLMQYIVMCILHNNISIRVNGAFLGLSSIQILYAYSIYGIWVFRCIWSNIFYNILSTPIFSVKETLSNISPRP